MHEDLEPSTLPCLTMRFKTDQDLTEESLASYGNEPHVLVHSHEQFLYMQRPWETIHVNWRAFRLQVSCG